MYRILNLGGKQVGSTWAWEAAPDFSVARTTYEGVYIMCGRNGRDNPALTSLYDAAFAAGLKVGFYVELEDGEISYAKQLLGLLGWYGGGRKLGLPPAIIFPGSDRSPHVIRSDFDSYFKQFVIDSTTLSYVVLGFNEDSLKQVLESDGEDTTTFKNLITNSRVRLWMFKYGDTAPEWLGPYKSAWMWGNAPGQNIVDFVSTPAPEPTPLPEVEVPTSKYRLVVDVWEGQLELDEEVLQDAGVDGIVVRLNDMSGGHHMDTNFVRQWDQAVGFARAPYFVYNPWVNGKTNYQYLYDHCPEGVGKVFIDVEVKYILANPTTYGRELANFNYLVRQKWEMATYTGAWFIPYVTPWDTGEYWWARYPYLLYPPSRIPYTWQALIEVLNTMAWNPGAAPGPVKMWQCTADRLILPGCGGRAIDINIFQGTKQELIDWMGGYVPESIPANALEILWQWYQSEVMK